MLAGFGKGGGASSHGRLFRNTALGHNYLLVPIPNLCDLLALSIGQTSMFQEQIS